MFAVDEKESKSNLAYCSLRINVGDPQRLRHGFRRRLAEHRRRRQRVSGSNVRPGEVPDDVENFC